jgi:hypothetical protein
MIANPFIRQLHFFTVNGYCVHPKILKTTAVALVILSGIGSWIIANGGINYDTM